MNLATHPWMQPVAKASPSERAEIADLLDRQNVVTRRIRNSFLNAIATLGNAIDVKKIIALLREGRVLEAINVVDAAELAAGFQRIAAAGVEAVVGAGQAAAKLIPVPTAVEFTFGVTNPNTVLWLQNYEYNLIREMTAEARLVVGDVIRAGVERGTNPIDIARDVKQHIGLTQRQSKAVLNFRRALEEMDPVALERKLRDKRFDGSVARAIRDQKPLDKASVDKMVARYQDRYLKYRAETIARTEAMRSVNSGAMLAWQQAVDAGKIPVEAIVRKWVFTHDARTRPAHRQIPGMNPDGVGFNEMFRTPDGPLLYPGDPNGPPEATINCRCVTIIRYRPSRAV